jgi:integrase
MKPDNARQPKSTAGDAKTRPELGQKLGQKNPKPSKTTPAYWLANGLHRRTYTHKGQVMTVPEWHARLSHGGKQERVALATNDKVEASRRAAALFRAVSLKGWEAGLAEVLPGKTKPAAVPTVGEFIAAVEKVADVAPRSICNYAVCFRKIVSDAFGIRATAARFDYRNGGHAAWQARIDRIRLDKIVPARVQAVLNSRINDHRGNPLAEQRARTTAASVLRQAKSLFSPKIKLPFAKVPNPFEGVHVKAGAPRKYQSTIDARQLLRDAQSELAVNDPEAFKAILLALGAGLRRDEIDKLQWQQIDSAAGKIRILTTTTFSPKSDSSEAEVYVDAGLCAALDAYRPKATGLYVLESSIAPRPASRKAHYRANCTLNRSVAWLRSKGVLAFRPHYALRKEFGSLINAAAGIHAASSQLRHAQIGLTAQYYVDNRRRVAPEIGAMLAVPSESQTAAKP